MINVLPPDIQQSMVYGRRNRQLTRWVLATIVGIVGIGIVVIAGFFYINFQTNAYAKEVERNKASLIEQNLEETQARVEEIDGSVKLALDVLSREVLFSKLIRGIGAAMPPGSALQNLSIGDVEGALDLQAIAFDYETASQVQVNLADPKNEIFEKADIVSIACNSESGDDASSDYPCQVNIRALFSKNSPYLFSSNTTGASQ